jgi:signal peptidase I
VLFGLWNALGLLPVLVRGPSMAPTLRDGDALLARRHPGGGWRGGRAVRRGDIVVARFRARPDLLVVKRAIRIDGSGWWLLGDNDYVADDSRAYGVADVEARVVLRYWPEPRRL